MKTIRLSFVGGLMATASVFLPWVVASAFFATISLNLVQIVNLLFFSENTVPPAIKAATLAGIVALTMGSVFTVIPRRYMGIIGGAEILVGSIILEVAFSIWTNGFGQFGAGTGLAIAGGLAAIVADYFPIKTRNFDEKGAETDPDEGNRMRKAQGVHRTEGVGDEFSPRSAGESKARRP